jgi:hypothetical protein
VFPRPLFLKKILLIKSAYMLGPAQALDTRRHVQVGEPSEARSSTPGVRPSLSLGEIESSRDPSDHDPHGGCLGSGAGLLETLLFLPIESCWELVELVDCGQTIGSGKLGKIDQKKTILS